MGSSVPIRILKQHCDHLQVGIDLGWVVSNARRNRLETPGAAPELLELNCHHGLSVLPRCLDAKHAKILFIKMWIAQTAAHSGTYIDDGGGKSSTRQDVAANRSWDFALQRKAWIHLDGAARYNRRGKPAKGHPIENEKGVTWLSVITGLKCIKLNNSVKS